MAFDVVGALVALIPEKVGCPAFAEVPERLPQRCV